MQPTLFIMVILFWGIAACDTLPVQRPTRLTPAQEKARAAQDKSADLFGLPSHFQPVYRMTREEGLTRPTAKRQHADITVPPGLTREALTLNLAHAAKVLYQKYRPQAISINAFRESEGDAGYPAGLYRWAPYGRWEVQESVALDQYQAVIELSEFYFKKSKVLPKGTVITLHNTIFQTPMIRVYRTATSDHNEDLVVSVPDGTHAEIIDFRTFPMPTDELIQYHVKVAYQGKIHKGWVHGWETVTDS
jgi:hypothetical protein